MGIFKKAVVTLGATGILGASGYFGIPLYYQGQANDLIKKDNLGSIEKQAHLLEEKAPKVVYDFLMETPLDSIRKNKDKNPAFTIPIKETNVKLEVSVLPIDTHKTSGLNLFKSGTKNPDELKQNGQILVFEAKMENGIKAPDGLHLPSSFRAMVTDSTPLTAVEIENALKIENPEQKKAESEEVKKEEKKTSNAQKVNKNIKKEEEKKKVRTIFPYFNGDHFSHTKGIDAMNIFSVFSKKYTQCIQKTCERICDYSKERAFYEVISKSWLGKITNIEKPYIERTPEGRLAKTRDYKERHPILPMGMIVLKSETGFEKEARELEQSLKHTVSAGYWVDYLKGKKIQIPSASSETPATPTKTETVLTGTLFDTERKELERNLAYGKSAQEWADALRGEIAESKRPETGPRLVQEKPKV